MRTEPFSKCENQSDSQIGCKLRTWIVLTGWFSPPRRTFGLVLMAILIAGSHWPVLTKNQTENKCRFLTDEWEPPNTGIDNVWKIQLSKRNMITLNLTPNNSILKSQNIITHTMTKSCLLQLKWTLFNCNGHNFLIMSISFMACLFADDTHCYNR